MVGLQKGLCALLLLFAPWVATYYHPSLHGGVTASGQPYDHYSVSAACHYAYPLGTWFRVSYNGSTIDVQCNDRGAFMYYPGGQQHLDLSGAAFEQLAPLSRGRIQIQVEVISQ